MRTQATLSASALNNISICLLLCSVYIHVYYEINASNNERRSKRNHKTSQYHGTVDSAYTVVRATSQISRGMAKLQNVVPNKAVCKKSTSDTSGKITRCHLEFNKIVVSLQTFKGLCMYRRKLKFKKKIPRWQTVAFLTNY